MEFGEDDITYSEVGRGAFCNKRAVEITRFEILPWQSAYQRH